MFIFPFSLFVIATYLRPRTEAELSYIITAIECLSGLWCLLFAPFQIQLGLIGLFLIQNRDSITSHIEKKKSTGDTYLDLSGQSNRTIDITAESVGVLLLTSANPSNVSDPDLPAVAQTPLIPLTQPKSVPTYSLDSTHSPDSLASDDAPRDESPLVIPRQWVQMQYRGNTYFKSIPMG